MRYKIELEYDGTNYSGWQKQGHGLSIQEIIEDSVAKLSGQNTEVIGSGRTDAGVHAISQIAHFDLDKKISKTTIVNGLNYYLGLHNRLLISNFSEAIYEKYGNFYSNYKFPSGQGIIVKSCEIVDENFHARFSSKMRHYRYIIINRMAPLGLMRNRAWHIIKKLNVDLMCEACQVLIGKHDFSSFRDSQCQALSPIKTMDDCRVYREGDKVIFDFSAKSFLHHMIRNIVGTLKDVGIEKISVDRFHEILEAKDRKAAGMNAPAYGLYFLGVDY